MKIAITLCSPPSLFVGSKALAEITADAPQVFVGEMMIDGREAELIFVGRTAYARFDRDRVEQLDKEVLTPVLAEAIDALAQGIWGEDWSRAVAELAGLNNRTTARDRVRKYGLPPPIVAALAALAERRDARELAGVMRAVARYWDAHKELPPVTPMHAARDFLASFRGIDLFSDDPKALTQTIR